MQQRPEAEVSRHELGRAVAQYVDDVAGDVVDRPTFRHLPKHDENRSGGKQFALDLQHAFCLALVAEVRAMQTSPWFAPLAQAIEAHPQPGPGVGVLRVAIQLERFGLSGTQRGGQVMDRRGGILTRLIRRQPTVLPEEFRQAQGFVLLLLQTQHALCNAVRRSDTPNRVGGQNGQIRRGIHDQLQLFQCLCKLSG